MIIYIYNGQTNVLKGKNKTEKECFEIFQKQIDALKPLREILWNYYNLHRMTGLP